MHALHTCRCSPQWACAWISATRLSVKRADHSMPNPVTFCRAKVRVRIRVRIRVRVRARARVRVRVRDRVQNSSDSKPRPITSCHCEHVSARVRVRVHSVIESRRERICTHICMGTCYRTGAGGGRCTHNHVPDCELSSVTCWMLSVTLGTHCQVLERPPGHLGRLEPAKSRMCRR